LKVIERLRFIRALGLDHALSPNSRKSPPSAGARRGTILAQFLARFDEQRRYATLAASLVKLAATLTDTALEMHDRILGNLFKQGQQKQRAHFEQRGQAINEKVRLYVSVGKALIAAKEQATDPYQALEAVVPWERFVAFVEEAATLFRPRDLDYLDLLDDLYSQIRKYSPACWKRLPFMPCPPCNR